MSARPTAVKGSCSRCSSSSAEAIYSRGPKASPSNTEALRPCATSSLTLVYPALPSVMPSSKTPDICRLALQVAQRRKKSIPFDCCCNARLPCPAIVVGGNSLNQARRTRGAGSWCKRLLGKYQLCHQCNHLS
jgi:hypothetical protein